jgi:hypothetical protein
MNMKLFTETTSEIRDLILHLHNKILKLKSSNPNSPDIATLESIYKKQILPLMDDEFISNTDVSFSQDESIKNKILDICNFIDRNTN